jgi:hypothetical protein
MLPGNSSFFLLHQSGLIPQIQADFPVSGRIPRLEDCNIRNANPNSANSQLGPWTRVG